MNARSAGALGALLLIGSTLSALAADCSPQDGDQLLREEQQFADAVRDCARMEPRVANDGGPEGECVASPRQLDVTEAANASCLSDKQLERFDSLARQIDSNCALIEDWKVEHNYVLDAQCRRDRAWLSALRERQARDRAASEDRDLATPAALLDRESAREASLKDCAQGSRESILSGNMADGVCSGDWSYLSPAEAKAAGRMSSEELRRFRQLSFSYQTACAELSGKLGDKAHSPSLCGADWSWLERTGASAPTSGSGGQVGRTIDKAPF